jgi:hypothetical protein
MATRSQLRRQALAETNVRYGAETRGLKELLLQAAEGLRQGLDAEQTAANEMRSYLRHAGPQMVAQYHAQTGDYNKAASLFQSDLSKLGPSASLYKAFTAQTIQTAGNGLHDNALNAAKEFTARQGDVAAGHLANVRSIHGQYQQTVGQVGTRLQDVSRQRGQYFTTALGKLEREAQQSARDEAKLRAQARYQNAQINLGRQRNRIAQQNADTGRYRAHHPRTGKGRAPKPSYTATQKRSFLDSVYKANSLLDQAPRKLSQHQLRNRLLASFPIHVVNAALDIHVHGFLHPSNYHYWRHHGIPVPKRWVPTGARMVGEFNPFP